MKLILIVIGLYLAYRLILWILAFLLLIKEMKE